MFMRNLAQPILKDQRAYCSYAMTNQLLKSEIRAVKTEAAEQPVAQKQGARVSSSPVELVFKADLYSIFMISQSNGWAVGEARTIVCYYNEALGEHIAASDLSTMVVAAVVMAASATFALTLTLIYRRG